MLQTIYVLNKEILQLLGLKSAVYNQEWVIMAVVNILLLKIPLILLQNILLDIVN